MSLCSPFISSAGGLEAEIQRRFLHLLMSFTCRWMVSLFTKDQWRNGLMIGSNIEFPSKSEGEDRNPVGQGRSSSEWSWPAWSCQEREKQYCSSLQTPKLCGLTIPWLDLMVFGVGLEPTQSRRCLPEKNHCSSQVSGFRNLDRREFGGNPASFQHPNSLSYSSLIILLWGWFIDILRLGLGLGPNYQLSWHRLRLVLCVWECTINTLLWHQAHHIQGTLLTSEY